MKTMRTLLVFAGAMLAAASMHAQYIQPDFFSVDTQQRYVQTGTGNSTSPETYSAGTSGQYAFIVSVESNSGNLSGNPTPTVTANAGLYNGGNTSLGPNGNNWRLTNYYSASGGLLTDFPDGTTYSITQNDTSTNHTISAALSGALTPATPYMATINVVSGSIIGWSGNVLQVTTGTVLDMTTSTFANWNSGTSALFNHAGLFVNHNGSDIVNLESFSDGASGYLGEATGQNNYLSTNGLTIASGSSYFVEMEFNAIAGIDQTYGGSTMVSLYTARTTFSIQAIPEPSTYVEIFGVVAMVGAMIHRRRRQAA